MLNSGGANPSVVFDRMDLNQILARTKQFKLSIIIIIYMLRGFVI
jgi:hypothetical protein